MTQTTSSSSSSAASLPLQSGPISSIPWREDEVRRALKHHARAIRALRGNAYETLSGATREQLIQKLESDWNELRRRLRTLRRGEASASDATSSARDEADNESAPTSSWMQRLTARFS